MFLSRLLDVDIREEWTWLAARRQLPFDLAGLASETGLLKRCRAFADADSLTRALLLCAVPGSTFHKAARWGRDSGLFDGTGPALFWRMRHATAFLRKVFELSLASVRLGCPADGRFGEWEIVAVDATVLTGPGSKGTDKVLHTEYHLGSRLPLRMELTDSKGGETFKRHPDLKEGLLVLADRGYGHGPGLAALLDQGCKFLVRFEPQSIRLLDEAGERLTSARGEALVPSRGAAELSVLLPGSDVPLRAIGERNPEGSIVWYATNLRRKELRANKARSLYSQRWQVELFFKRMKSLLDLDAMPSRDGPTTEAWVWAKLILCLLAVLMAHETFSPWEEGEGGIVALEAVLPGGLACFDGTPGFSGSEAEEARVREAQTQAAATI